jgi:hypothetical protein
MNYIETQLEKKAKKESGGQEYYTQWCAKKNVISSLLSTIPQYFPHYSLHDATHSETILRNIELFVGEAAIKKLSIVDLWLLLTSAYCHDLGMLVDADDKKLFLKQNSEFIHHVKDIQANENSSLHEFSKQFEVRDGELYHNSDKVTSDNLDGIKFLIADFVRKHHGKRTVSKIETKLELQNGSIPHNIITVLKAICHAHTQSREKLWELSESESPTGTEDCHPRYIACLLRLGDLLDISSDRVSNVLLGTLSAIPWDSEAYLQSNRSIESRRINISVIEMTAVCPIDNNCDDKEKAQLKAYLAAQLTSDWFEMIDEEITFQTKHWNKIAPNKEYGSLPATGDMIVKLEGYDNFSGKERPRFTVNDSRAMEMLQGANLYNKPEQCIRELLQNAADATYLRIFKEHPEYKDKTDIQYLDSFIKLCQEERYAIEVSLRKNRVDGDISYWTFTLIDKGIGMSKEDLQYLYNTGSGSQNKEKQKIVDAMPDWMRPSGTFGIGFQSVFLVTDKVQMRTRRLGQAETFNLTLYNPAGKEKGNILKSTVIEEDIPIGTMIEFEIEMPKKNYGDSYDFICDDPFDNAASSITEQIKDFSKGSYIDLMFSLNDKKSTLSRHSDYTFDYYDKETGLHIKLNRISNNLNVFRSDEGILLFRGQKVDDNTLILGLDGLHYTINIAIGNAKDILTLNRNSIKDCYIDILTENIELAISHYILDRFHVFDTYTKQHAAAFIESREDFVQRFNERTGHIPQYYWKDIQLDDRSNLKYQPTINELLEADHIQYTIEDDYRLLEFYQKNIKKVFFSIRHWEPFSGFLFSILYKTFSSIQFRKDGIHIIRKNERIADYIVNDNKTRTKWLKCTLSIPHHLSAREYMPCNERYKPLEIKGSPDTGFLWRFEGFSYPRMASPFVSSSEKIEYKVNDQVIDFVYNHRANKTVTKEQIRESYELFKRDWQKALDAVNGAALE